LNTACPKKTSHSNHAKSAACIQENFPKAKRGHYGRAPAREGRGGQCPGVALFEGEELLVKRKNIKWSFMVFTTTWWWW